MFRICCQYPGINASNGATFMDTIFYLWGQYPGVKYSTPFHQILYLIINFSLTFFFLTLLSLINFAV